jgi:hypothetical protein
LKTLAGQALDAFLRQHPSGYIQNYSFDIQFDAGHNTVVEAHGAETRAQSRYTAWRATPISFLRIC